MKEKILDNIDNCIALIVDNPELFHDGIDDDIITMLKQIRKNIESEEKK